jgi:hypothetical protein
VLACAGCADHTAGLPLRRARLPHRDGEPTPRNKLQGTFTAHLRGDRRGRERQSGPLAQAAGHDLNYLALTSVQTWGVIDDSYHALQRADLGDQLTHAGLKWRAYMEGLTSAGCIDSPLPYDPGHNPFAFYGGGCPSEVVPFSAFASDVGNGDVRFSWIGPTSAMTSITARSPRARPAACRQDDHRLPVAEGGSVLFRRDRTTAAAATKFSRSSSGPATNTPSSMTYSHYPCWHIEDLLRLPRLANAASAPPMTDLAGA